MRSNSTFMQVFPPSGKKIQPTITAAPSNNLTKSKPDFVDGLVYDVDDQGSATGSKLDNANCKKTDKHAT